MNGSSYIPSFDFRLFELPQFSPLQAQEFGVETIFGAADPPWFVDRSIDALFGLGNLPFFQDASGRDPRLEAELDVQRKEEAFRRAREEYEKFKGVVTGSGSAAKNCGTTKCHWWEKMWPIGRRDGECCHDVLVSDDSSVGTTSPSGARAGDTVKEYLAAIPGGGGTFLIALLALVFIFLFVRK